MRVLIASDQLPGSQIGLTFAGNAEYVKSLVSFFIQRGDTVAFLLFEARVDFFNSTAESLGFELFGPQVNGEAGRIQIRSFRANLACVAWRLYLCLPPFIKRAVAVLRRGYRRRRGFAHVLGRFRTPEEIRYFHALANRWKPDLILFDGIFNYCGGVDSCNSWIITHEIKHERVESFLKRGFVVLPGEFTRETEAAVLRECANLIAIQEDDAAKLREMCPGARVVVVPASFNAVPALTSTRCTVDCIFVGSSSFHNVNGIRWFLVECWPMIRSSRPDCSLSLFGSVGAQLPRLPAGVRDCGVVEEIGSAYRQSRVVIVPLQVGSGLKVKLVEALVYGRPIVTTPIGVQGLSALAPPPFIVAESAEAFARAVCSVLSSSTLQDELHRRARAAGEHFTPAKAFAQLEHALRDPS